MSGMIPLMKRFSELLAVSVSAGDDEIKKAYRKR